MEKVVATFFNDLYNLVQSLIYKKTSIIFYFTIFFSFSFLTEPDSKIHSPAEVTDFLLTVSGLLFNHIWTW